MSKNNEILNFGILFGLINGLIDDKLYVPRYKMMKDVIQTLPQYKVCMCVNEFLN